MESTISLKSLPALDIVVAGLAEDADKIMVSLYDLQKSLNRTNSPPFTNVRIELRSQWEGLRAYLQRCYGFGADVLTLKDALEAEETADLIEFLGDMKASADELRDISLDLKNKDMSKAFSKGNEPGNSENTPNPLSIEGIKNVNLQHFVVAIGSPSERKYLGEIDKALGRISSNFNSICEFWEHAKKGCDSLITHFKTTGQKISPIDSETIISNWRRYQEATEKAIGSITKTDNLILVEAVNEGKPARFGLGMLIEFIRRWLTV